MQIRSTTSWIDLDSFRFNLRLLRKLVPTDQLFCPMVKADAYGHSLKLLLPSLISEGAQHLGVALVEEAFTLRDLGYTDEILLFGHFQREHWPEMVRQRVTPVIGHEEQWQIIKQSKLPSDYHLKFNLGMNRLGFEPSEAVRLSHETQQAGHLKLLGVCQHWPCGDTSGDAEGISAHQFQKFEIIKKAFSQNKKIKFHVHNSSGLLTSSHSTHWLPYKGLGARPGIALYGYSSVAGNNFGLKPVMTLTSQIILERILKKGEAVSYGGIFVAPQDMKIGVVEAGYADGVRRSLSNKTMVQVGSQRVQQIGRICMDYFMVDLSDYPTSALHQKVTLFGGQDHCFQNAEDVAQSIGTISYEILTGVSSRVPRRSLQ